MAVKKTSRKKSPVKAARDAKKKPLRRGTRAAKPPRRVVIASLADVRAAIDLLDDILVPLLARRYYFVTQAAQFKPSVKGVVVLSRVEEIIVRVRRMAEDNGMDPDTIETVYRTLIDAYTAAEQRQWRTLHAPSGKKGRG